MAHIEPLDTDQHPELAPIMAVAEAAMGFVPNSTRTMAHMAVSYTHLTLPTMIGV